MSRMNKILEIHGSSSALLSRIMLSLSLEPKLIDASLSSLSCPAEADGDMVVQPGIGWQDVNAHLASLGIKMFFPLDPGPGASIGGMAACGCSGTNAVRYGTAKAEWFLNLFVLR